ncbi:MAG TPA: hypothetical protein DHV48_03500 [Prolixibacteraceae bacterium]|nr:hypothetical protein [Prolixibacteraceae bacterium]
MENVKNEILKASVKNDRLEVTYRENFTEANYSNEVSKKCSQVVHADLRAALERLKLHLVVVCEQPEAGKVNFESIHEFKLDDLDNYIVTGYTIGGNDESAGVTIIGQKLLKSGQVLNLIAPFTKFEENDNYDFSGELYADIQACNWEVEEYLFSEKWGIKQTEFDFDAPEDAQDIEITISDSPGKKGKKINMKKLAELAEMRSMTGTD